MCLSLNLILVLLLSDYDESDSKGGKSPAPSTSPWKSNLTTFSRSTPPPFDMGILSGITPLSHSNLHQKSVFSAQQFSREQVSIDNVLIFTCLFLH